MSDFLFYQRFLIKKTIHFGCLPTKQRIGTSIPCEFCLKAYFRSTKRGVGAYKFVKSLLLAWQQKISKRAFATKPIPWAGMERQERNALATCVEGGRVPRLDEGGSLNSVLTYKLIGTRSAGKGIGFAFEHKAHT